MYFPGVPTLSLVLIRRCINFRVLAQAAALRALPALMESLIGWGPSWCPALALRPDWGILRLCEHLYLFEDLVLLGCELVCAIT